MKKGKTMYDILIPLAVFAGWFILMAWVLPRFGVDT